MRKIKKQEQALVLNTLHRSKKYQSIICSRNNNTRSQIIEMMEKRVLGEPLC
jgi:hypothetical protein